MRQSYTTNLSDIHRGSLRPLIRSAKPGARPREVDLREVVETSLYQGRTGRRRDMPPGDLPPKSAAWDDFDAWRDDGTRQANIDALHEEVRRKDGRQGTPSRAVIDSRSVEAAETGGEERGDDGDNRVGGRKRHVADRRGPHLGMVVTAASVDIRRRGVRNDLAVR